jgi:hypothetical protein
MLCLTNLENFFSHSDLYIFPLFIVFQVVFRNSLQIWELFILFICTLNRNCVTISFDILSCILLITVTELVDHGVVQVICEIRYTILVNTSVKIKITSNGCKGEMIFNVKMKLFSMLFV